MIIYGHAKTWKEQLRELEEKMNWKKKEGREGRQKEREKENLSREKLEIDKASLKQQTHKIEAKQRIVAEILPIVKVFCTINT